MKHNKRVRGYFVGWVDLRGHIHYSIKHKIWVVLSKRNAENLFFWYLFGKRTNLKYNLVIMRAVMNPPLPLVKTRLKSIDMYL